MSVEEEELGGAMRARIVSWTALVAAAFVCEGHGGGNVVRGCGRVGAQGAPDSAGSSVRKGRDRRGESWTVEGRHDADEDEKAGNSYVGGLGKCGSD